MRNKKLVIGVVGLLILFSLTSLAETKKLKQIGRYTFVRIKGEVPTEEVMKILLDKYAGDISMALIWLGTETFICLSWTS